MGYTIFFFKYNIWLQTWLSLKVIILTKKINMTTYFENLTVRLHVLYVFNT